jgi:hypothetical protein
MEISVGMPRGAESGFLCGFGLFGLLMLGFWIWSLVDAINNPRFDSNKRLIWVLVIVLVGPLGSLIYLFAGRQ